MPKIKKSVLLSSLTTGAFVAAGLSVFAVSAPAVHAQDLVIKPGLNECHAPPTTTGHNGGQQGRPIGPHGGSGGLPEELYEKVARPDSEIPVQYVDNPNLKTGETRVIEEGEHGYDYLAPDSLSYVDNNGGGVGKVDVPANVAAANGKYRIEITNDEEIYQRDVRISYSTTNYCEYGQYDESVYASDKEATVQVSADTASLSVYLRGSFYARKGGSFDKGPVTVKVYAPDGTVVAQREYMPYLSDDHFKRIESAIPAKPRIIERGTAPVLTTKYVDEAGKDLAAPVDGDLEKKDFPGYDFVSTSKDGNVTTHSYKKHVEPAPQLTTKYVDEAGKDLAAPVDGDLEKKDFPGYDFVSTSKDGNVTTHSYKKHVEPAPKPQNNTPAQQTGNKTTREQQPNATHAEQQANATHAEQGGNSVESGTGQVKSAADDKAPAEAEKAGVLAHTGSEVGFLVGLVGILGVAGLSAFVASRARARK